MTAARTGSCSMGRPGSGEDTRCEERLIKNIRRATPNRCGTSSRGKLQRLESTFAIEHFEKVLARITEVIEHQEIEQAD